MDEVTVREPRKRGSGQERMVRKEKTDADGQTKNGWER
jgi:hypothetical protein